MSKVYMLVGIQGSGKTTYARVMSKELNIPIVSSDSIRDEMPELKEELVFPEVYRRCAEYISSHTDFIYDATNVTPNVRKRLWDNMEKYGLTDFEVEAHYFVVDLELSKERVEKRNQDPNERFFPIDKLEDYANHLIEPTLEEGFSKVVKIVHYVHE